MVSIQQYIFGRKLFDRRVYVFVAAIALLFAFDAVAVYFEWYWAYSWLDIPVHAVAGFLLSLLMYYVVFANAWSRRLLKRPRTKEQLFTSMVFWVLVIAILWEIAELLHGRTYVSPKYAVDLFMDISITTLGAYAGFKLVRVLR